MRFSFVHAQNIQNGHANPTLCLRLLTFAAGNVWLKRWADMNSATGRNPDVGKYIGVYFAFGIGGALLVVVQTLILWIFCSIEVSFSDLGTLPARRCSSGRKLNWFPQASRKLHERMAFAIFRSPMSFFET